MSKEDLICNGGGAWQLSALPEYTGGGRLSESLYPCGLMFCEIDSESTEQAQMQIASGADENDFELYIKCLKEHGFCEMWQNRVDSDCGFSRYIRLRGGDRDIYLSYRDGAKQIAFIDDARHQAAVTPPENVSEDSEAQFFMYGLNMDPGGFNPKLDPDNNTSGYPNCGMLLAIRCPDRSVIMVDGGLFEQFNAAGLMHLDKFLRRIAEVDEQEPVRLHWFLTHFHHDHTEGFYKLLSTYSEHYKLENVFCNLPVLSMFPKGNNEKGIRDIAKLIGELYPNCNEIKMHTGEEFSVGGIKISVIYTHEDNVCAESGITRIVDVNDTGTVIKVTAKDFSLAVLGDINAISEEKILSSFGSESLKSDIVQVAHHNFNFLSEIYRNIAAEIAWFTQAEQGTLKNEKAIRNSGEVKKYSERQYYVGNITYTVGFAKRDGKVEEIYRYNKYLK